MKKEIYRNSRERCQTLPFFPIPIPEHYLETSSGGNWAGLLDSGKTQDCQAIACTDRKIDEKSCLASTQYLAIAGVWPGECSLAPPSNLLNGEKLQIIAI